MKTKEEIIEHLKKVGYTQYSIGKITGWMIGAGLKEPSEIIKYKKGLNDFDDFWSWVNSEEDDELEDLNEEEELVASLIADVIKNANFRDVTMTMRKLTFLTDLLIELQNDDE